MDNAAQKLIPALQAAYNLGERERVYLAHNLDLVPFLRRAHRLLHEFFPAATLELNLTPDPDIEDLETLFVHIRTDLPVSNALEALDSFDAAWDAEGLDPSGESLSFNLRFA